MKKKFIGVLSLVLCLMLCISLAACNKNKNKHEAKSEWMSNETHHWHECATKDHDDKLDEAEHAWNDGEVTTEPTEEAEGVRTFTCTVCRAQKTEPMEKLEHTHKFATEWSKNETHHWHAATCGHAVKSDEAEHAWNDGEVTTEPTEEAEGEKTFTCTVCGAKKTEPMEKLEHTHKFATEWSKNETHHWHAATCGHDVKSDEAEHAWNDGEVTTEPTYTADGVKTYTCTVCGEQKTESVTKLSPKDNTITVGTIEFTYNAKAQPIDSLVNADNKEGMTIKYVDVDGTDYEESATAPTNAGTYQYTITIPATAEWNAAEVSGTFTIEKYELTMLYEKERIAYDGKAQEDGTKRIWFHFNTLEDNTDVNICVILESANVGARVSEIWLPELLRTNNYTVDKNKVQIEIVAKTLSELKFEINEDDVDFDLSEQTITREIAGVNGEKVIVEITFSPAELDNEEGLELSFDGKAGATCIIKFQTETLNYELDLTDGELKLVRAKTE